MNSYTIIEQYLSKPRLTRYLKAVSYDKAKALKLYQTNLRLSQSFYPLLSLLEVILRNSLNKELSLLFKSKSWIIDQKDGFMSNKSLGPDFFLRREVNNRIKKLQSDKKPVTNDNIVAGLTFGFWVALFYPDHFRLLKGAPLKILTNKPKEVNGTSFKKKLDYIRAFRNKIYHNEPIVFSTSDSGATIFTTFHAENIYQNIREIFTFFNLDFKKWTRRVDNIPLEIDRARAVYDHYHRNFGNECR